MPQMADVVAVRTLINKDSSRPASMPELSEFWKSCSDEEKKQFGNEARKLLGVE
jgi:hypothetical protein